MDKELKELVYDQLEIIIADFKDEFKTDFTEFKTEIREEIVEIRRDNAETNQKLQDFIDEVRADRQLQDFIYEMRADREAEKVTRVYVRKAGDLLARV